MTEWLLALFAIACYLAAMFQVNIDGIRRLALLGFCAICAHAVLLYQTMHTPTGLNFGVFNAFSLITWMIAVLLLTGLRAKSLATLTLVIFPLAACSILLVLWLPSQQTLSTTLPLGIRLHIVSSILSIGFVIMSIAQAGLLAFQERQLRHKAPGWVMQRLPPLQLMEGLLFQIILLGFALLTLSITTGIVFQDDFFSQAFAHKKFFSIFAWLVFSTLLWGRWQYGWRGQRAVRWHLAGSLLLLLGYFGSKVVTELILHR